MINKITIKFRLDMRSDSDKDFLPLTVSPIFKLAKIFAPSSESDL